MRQDEGGMDAAQGKRTRTGEGTTVRGSDSQNPPAMNPRAKLRIPQELQPIFFVILQAISQNLGDLNTLKAFIQRFPRLKYRRQLAATFLLILFLILFSIARCASSCCGEDNTLDTDRPEATAVETNDTILLHALYVDSILSLPRKPVVALSHPKGRFITRFRTEQIFRDAFPDLNDVQLATAQRLGIAAIADREEAEQRKEELVYVGENPYYALDKMRHSIPFLVPRAARLLEEISHNFADSLMSRGMPLYRPMVTSILRTEHDITRLRRVNANASENSCHRYGTTFDICYNKFVRVIDPEDSITRDVWPGELKALLAEVIEDQRTLGTCYVKYEVRQSCFHVTAR